MRIMRSNVKSKGGTNDSNRSSLQLPELFMGGKSQCGRTANDYRRREPHKISNATVGNTSHLPSDRRWLSFAPQTERPWSGSDKIS
jgi:hypothetical protein